MKNIKYVLFTLVASMLVANNATPMKRQQAVAGDKRIKLDPEKLELTKNAVQAVLAHNSNLANNIDQLHDAVKEQLRTNENIKTYVIEALKQIRQQQEATAGVSLAPTSTPAATATTTPPTLSSNSTSNASLTDATNDYQQKQRERYEQYKQQEDQKKAEEAQKQAAEKQRKALELASLKQQLESYIQTLVLINENQGNLNTLQVALIEHDNQSLNEHLQTAINNPNQDGTETTLGCLVFVCSTIETFIGNNQQNIVLVAQQCKQVIEQTSGKILSAMLTTYPQQLKDTDTNKKNIKHVITVLNLLRESVSIEPIDLVQESETPEQAKQRKQEEEINGLMAIIGNEQLDKTIRNDAERQLNALLDEESKQLAQEQTTNKSHATHDTKDSKKDDTRDIKPTSDKASRDYKATILDLTDENDDTVVDGTPHQSAPHHQTTLPVARMTLLRAILNKNCPLYALTTEQAQQDELLNGNPTNALIVRINTIYFQNYTDEVLATIQNAHHADPALIISLIKDHVSSDDLLNILNASIQ